jgi:hypothetical protein
VNIGDACESRCGNGLSCSEGRCAEGRSLVQENGEPCDYDWVCESNFCERDVGDYCEDGLCDIPACDGCGVCADPPTVEICPSM